MEKMVIPHEPEALHLVITRLWNGENAPEVNYADVWLSQSPAGLVVHAEALARADQHVPSAQSGTRFDGLWDYDVVEAFLVGEDGKYLEIELGAGGHWLVFAFDGPRQRSHDYSDFKPELQYTPAPVGQKWKSVITIPWDMVPKPFARMNAYAISGGQFCAYSPVPGQEPNFHQPDIFPAAALAE